MKWKMLVFLIQLEIVDGIIWGIDMDWGMGIIVRLELCFIINYFVARKFKAHNNSGNLDKL